MKSIYIAGPMSGYPEFNFPAFFAAQKKLEAEGWKVWNPAEKDSEADLDPEAAKTGDERLAIENGFDFREAFAWDMLVVIGCDAMYMLKGWEESAGATAEHTVAKVMKLRIPGYEIYYQEQE